MSHLLSKMRLLDSSLPRKFLDSKFGNFVSLIHTKSFKSQISQKKNEEIRVMMRKPQGEEEDKELISIFTNITEIIGTKNVIAENKDSSTEDAHVRVSMSRDEVILGTQGVCRNVELSKQHLGCEEKSNLEVINDVSPIVHKITEIIRTQNAVTSIEERLDNSGFLFSSEIVEKVLKRCFKVGHCALRFFNWMKLQTGYCHTTGTYNTMISIAGEAMEFGLMEKLVEEMEIESCPKDIKTWTILISSYGKAKLIGKALVVFEKMRKSGCEPDEIAYKLIVHALCNVGKAEIAMEFYKEMVYKNMGVDMNFYKLLLNCLSGAGDLSAARSVGDDMINVSQIPEGNVYSCILRCYCISGRITEAIELLHELKSKKITLDPANFEILVKGLCRTGRIGDALEIIEIMKQNHVLNGEVYGIVINGYLRRNDIYKAFQLFSTMKESGYAPTASTYTELMQHLFRLNEYEKACNLYNEMLENGVEPDIVAITALVAGHVQNNNFSEAWSVFRSMKEKGIRATPKSYWVFIRELCKVSRPKEAISLLNEMQNSKMNIRGEIFHSVISCLERKGEVECIRTVEQMWRASKLYIQETELAGVPMDHHFLHARSKTVVDTCEPTKLNQEELKPKKLQLLSKSYSECDLQEICRILLSSMDWKSMQVALDQSTILFTPELVLDVLSSCQKHGHASLSFFSWVGQQAGYNHTTETFNMAIKIAGSAKDFKHMRNLFLEMKRRCCLVTSDTWTVIIMQYGRVGLTEISLKKFEEMKKDGVNPNRSTYKYLLMSLCGKKGCKVDEAIKIFEEMIRVGIVPDKELAELYLNCLCEWDKLSETRRCMKQLCTGGFSVPLSYSLVVRALCRAGKLDAALALVDEIGSERSTLDQYIYGSLVHGLLRGGRLEATLDKMEEMKQKGINPTVHVYTSLIVHYSKEKQFEKALDIFKKMKEEGCEPTIVTYSALIRGYMNVEMVSEAWNLFRRMKLKGPYPDFETYSMFITCLCKTNRSEEALQLIHEMLSVGIFPSTVNFRSVFHGLNREGKKHLAHTVCEEKWALMAKRKFLS